MNPLIRLAVSFFRGTARHSLAHPLGAVVAIARAARWVLWNVMQGQVQVAAPSPASTPERAGARTDAIDPPLEATLPTRFTSCLDVVVGAEGGFVDNPADPGGATKFGITIKTLAAWRRKPVSVVDVRALTLREASEIYKAAYWDPMRCGDLPHGIDLMMFDCGVNAGPRHAVIALQQALGLNCDGLIGPETLAAARAADRRSLILALARHRVEFYRGLPGWAIFGKGWGHRVEAVQQAALAML